MPDALFHLSLPVAGVIIIGALCLYSLAGTAVTRRFILPRQKVNGDDSEFTGAMVQAIMVFYGLAMALVAVSVWETHSEVSGIVSQEASRLGGLYRDVSGYPSSSASSSPSSSPLIVRFTANWESARNPTSSSAGN